MLFSQVPSHCASVGVGVGFGMQQDGISSGQSLNSVATLVPSGQGSGSAKKSIQNPPKSSEQDSGVSVGVDVGVLVGVGVGVGVHSGFTQSQAANLI